MMDTCDGALDRLSVWLGSVATRYYQLMCTAVMLLAFSILYAVCVAPLLGQYYDAKTLTDTLQRHNDRERELTVLVQRSKASSSYGPFDSSVVQGTLRTSREVLALLHRNAEEAGAVIATFSHDTATTSARDEIERERFRVSAAGSFAALTTLLSSLVKSETKFVIFALEIENSAWPDFSGLVQARFVLEMYRTQ